MIGWYVHDHGRGHLQRLACIAPHLVSAVTGLSSLDPPPGFPGGWSRLPYDHPTGHDDDVTAGGTMHWAPVHHGGLRARMTAIAAWVERARPSLFVVDVSVEVAVLVRALGVPVVVVAMQGDRTDRAHCTAYDLARTLLAPWPTGAGSAWPERWKDKTCHTGALSRFDGRVPGPPPGDRRVGILFGHGGTDVSPGDLEIARAASAGWTWTTGADDAWQLLRDSDVVVTHAGQNVLAEVAAARRPAIVLPQRRPFDEQLATGRALERAGIAVVRTTWPAAAEWPHLLSSAAGQDTTRWTQWSDGQGAARAAAAIEKAAACAPL